MLVTLLHIVQLVFSVLLILIVLLQRGGSGVGPAFGGGAAAQVFGGRGASNILAAATAVCAAVFMITSVLLAWLSRPAI